MCYGQQCSYYGRNSPRVQCGMVIVLYCVTLCILVFDVECVMVNNVVFMEGTDRECSVACLVLYCVTLYILLFGVEWFTVSSDVFMEGTDRQCSVACLVLHCVTVFILVFGVECVI